MSLDIFGSEFAERVVLDLVCTPSLSGQEQAAAAVFVRHAQAIGLQAEIDAVGNAIARRGQQDASLHLMLLGHIDTVPGEIPVRIEDGVLHGRGSVDAKGPLAAMLLATARAELPADVCITVVGAVGEEAAGSIGARHLVDRFTPNACIIGEPSGVDGVTLGYKGRLLGRVTASHCNAHSAGPHPSASDVVLEWWSRVRQVVEQHNMDRARVFEQVQASVRSLQSDEDGLIQRAAMELGFRLPPGCDPHAFAHELDAQVSDGLAVQWSGHEAAVVSPRNDPVVRALSAGVRSIGSRPRPKHKTGTADFNVVAPHWGCPIAAYGPGDSLLDHTPKEHLLLEEFHRSIDVLTYAVQALWRELLPAASPCAEA